MSAEISFNNLSPFTIQSMTLSNIKDDSVSSFSVSG